MDDLDKLGWEILNASADDCENLQQIYLQLGFEIQPMDNAPGNVPLPCDCVYRSVREAPLLTEIAMRIPDLVESGLLAVEMDEEGRRWKDLGDRSYVWRAWFRMTPRGRSVWESMESVFYPVEKSSAE